MRTFLAIELPTAIHAHLATVQQQVQRMLRQAEVADCFNWVAPEKTHITLRFLGETYAQQTAQIGQELPSILQQYPQFSLTLTEIGAFPHFRQPNVLWLGLGGVLPALQSVQGQIEALVQQVGFAPEQRAFAPHLTIARARRNALPVNLREAGRIVQTSAADRASEDRIAPGFCVTQIVHMQSELRPAGAYYTPLGYFALADRV